MTRLLATTLVFIGLAPAGTPVLVVTHVTVIDATGSPAQPDMTVIIRGGLIGEIGKSADVTIPKDAQVLDSTGKFLIPGLVDMHVHTSWDKKFIGPMMLAHGITGVREMFARDLPAIQGSRREVADGALTGPRILAAGPIVDGEGAPWPHSIVVRDAAEAHAAVDRIQSQGFDYVKVYSALSREAYFAVADEARKDGIPFAGHVPDTVTAIEASRAGQRSFEHLYGISRACSNREAELRKNPLSYFDGQKVELESFSEDKAAILFAELRRNGAWQTPTLVVDRNAALYSDPVYARTFANPSRLQYVPYALKAMWQLGLRLTPALKPDQQATSARYFQWQLHIVGEMQRAGVGILAGTDTPNPFVYPGFGLHDELGLLVQAGLTPMEALQAATRNPAQFFGKQDVMGTIERGKIADLDLLDADPLADIHNTQRLYAVIFGGRMIAKAGLDALSAKSVSNRWTANPAALTLIGLLLNMMRKPLYVAAALLLGVPLIFYFIRRQRRARPDRPETSSLSSG